MSIMLVLTIVFVLGVAGFFLGRAKAVAQLNTVKNVADKKEKPHSRPHYHGWWVFSLTVMPAIILFVVWSLSATVYLEQTAKSQLQDALGNTENYSESLSLGVVKSLAHGVERLDPQQRENLPQTYSEVRALMAEKGVALATEGQDVMVPVAVQWNKAAAFSSNIRAALTIALAIAGFIFGWMTIAPRVRARNNVESIVLWGLIAASTIAILTTVGIVFSMLFQTINFFSDVPAYEFFFGTVWDPRFAAAGATDSHGQFGLIPLLAGTLYIALVAMVFAVPVGLFAAIYMSEYAGAKTRAIVKPLLEVLAGIPTIVYGFFALVTVGPFLRDLSAALTGGQGFIMAQSVLTAGLVMGVMLIPFVSSLSDDIITAVPRSLRDGSLGLGATRSETIKRVILPAALPGIVGALLLTASRAIGETMIVVLAAGVAANLTLNPFEAMTTITVKIVNQLTGDLEFNSPQTLVAFALGITLFFLTLLMNIFALYIVRKYREQYE
ncbi:phosphate ABC transporter permease subunit PstC [Pseudochrobactrum sp. Wa41.01b-1]|uniref:phosphate ABC transporter permease subunit PstC n=1 Tax=Pseudochrobactrum sp. Wa41.01b-1 TaxID=2864102 RepID=UPI001C68CDA9|nr:phosphate ABC transporter permease subunit PstC [Pseudochrobactrum sp. Wa41.01b-1]QYM71939.1 phosphate ABC transporter permease subunit PstC [Pseudochrobactrum sp. Wa41.01b-1]